MPPSTPEEVTSFVADEQANWRYQGYLIRVLYESDPIGGQHVLTAMTDVGEINARFPSFPPWYHSYISGGWPVCTPSCLDDLLEGLRRGTPWVQRCGVVFTGRFGDQGHERLMVLVWGSDERPEMAWRGMPDTRFSFRYKHKKVRTWEQHNYVRVRYGQYSWMEPGDGFKDIHVKGIFHPPFIPGWSEN